MKISVWTMILVIVCALGIGFSSAMAIVSNCIENGNTVQANSFDICTNH